MSRETRDFSEKLANPTATVSRSMWEITLLFTHLALLFRTAGILTPDCALDDLKRFNGILLLGTCSCWGPTARNSDEFWGGAWPLVPEVILRCSQSSQLIIQ